MDIIPIGILPLVNNTIKIKITVELGCKPVTITVTYNKIAATFLVQKRSHGYNCGLVDFFITEF